MLVERGQSTVEVSLERIESQEDAERRHFVGSPTILVDGRDPFAVGETNYGLACRVYQTSEGLAGSPTKEQLWAALSSVEPTSPRRASAPTRASRLRSGDAPEE